MAGGERSFTPITKRKGGEGEKSLSHAEGVGARGGDEHKIVGSFNTGFNNVLEILKGGDHTIFHLSKGGGSKKLYPVGRGGGGGWGRFWTHNLPILFV